MTTAKASMAEYGIPPAQTFEDLRRLVDVAAKVGCSQIISSPLKVPCGRWSPPNLGRPLRPLYADAGGGRPIRRGFADRLAAGYAHRWLMASLAGLCRQRGLAFEQCKSNLVGIR